MTRYVPTAEEQAAIEVLTLAGYAVIRQRTYDALHERVRVAEVRAGMEAERRESCERWAHGCIAEERRLAARLNEVCMGAAALGVSIQDINAALEKASSQ